MVKKVVEADGHSGLERLRLQHDRVFVVTVEIHIFHVRGLVLCFELVSLEEHLDVRFLLLTFVTTHLFNIVRGRDEGILLG